MNTQSLVEFDSGPTDVRARVTTKSIADNNEIYAFQRELHRYVVAHPGTVLHLDMSNVRHFSCAVLSDLLQIQQELKQTKGSLRLQGIHGNVRSIMKLTGLGKMFTVEHRHAC